MAYIVRYCRHFGLALAVREARPYLAEAIWGTESRAERADAFDVQHGTDTSQIVMPWELPSMQEAGREVYHYETLPGSTVRQALESVPGTREEFALIDLGCGKGRVLMIGSQLGFAQIVGVELSRELVEISRVNIARYCASRRIDSRIFILQGDASDYEFPLRPLVIFLFNPFGAQTLERICRNLVRSLRQTPRPAYLLYLNPFHQKRIEAFRQFRRLDSPPGSALFRVLPFADGE